MYNLHSTVLSLYSPQQCVIWLDVLYLSIMSSPGLLHVYNLLLAMQKHKLMVYQVSSKMMNTTVGLLRVGNVPNKYTMCIFYSSDISFIVKVTNISTYNTHSDCAKFENKLYTTLHILLCYRFKNVWKMEKLVQTAGKCVIPTIYFPS